MSEKAPKPVRDDHEALIGLRIPKHVELLRDWIMEKRVEVAYGAKDDDAESEIRNRIDANVEVFVQRLRDRYGESVVNRNVLVQILLNPYGKIEVRRRREAEDFKGDDSILAFVKRGFGLARSEDSAS